nr:transglycosylase SLT domain-containing protein [bacterium]
SSDYSMQSDAFLDLSRWLYRNSRWDELITRITDRDRSPELRLYYAEAWMNTGRIDTAKRILKDLWIHQCDMPLYDRVGSLYRQVLAAAETPFPDLTVREMYDRAQSLDDAGRRHEADTAFQAVLAMDPPESLAASARIYRAKILTDTRQNTEALELYDRFISLHPGHPSIPTAYFRKSIIYRRLGDDDAYLRMVAEIEYNHRSSKWWPVAILGRGDFRRSRQEWDAAERDIDTVRQHGGSVRDAAYWKWAWLAYDREQYSVAADRLDQMNRKFRGTGWDMPMQYWRAMFRKTATDASASQWTPPRDLGELAADFSWKYYGQLAAAVTGTAIARPTDTDLPGLSPAETRDSSVIIARILDAAGYPERAAIEWNMAARRLSDPGEGFVIARATALNRAGEIPESRRLLIGYYKDRLDTGDVPLAVARLMVPYPDSLKPIYESASEPVGLDPLLAAAVTLQESGFDRRALSQNLAGGLMQVMPELFQRFSSKWPDPPAPEHYAEPKFNIRAGVEYLAWLLNTFDGSLPRALAGYNAGEHRVREWNDAYPYPDEIWIEHIPFTQTRMFVKHVLENYANYRLVYKGTDDL